MRGLVQHIRLFATNHLGSLIRQHSDLDTASDSRSTNSALEWQIDLLVPQLYDPASEVTQLAVSILTRACTDEETLEMVVRKGPQVEHLGEGAVELLTQLSRVFRFCLSSFRPMLTNLFAGSWGVRSG
jgi:large subunit ribosomal protein L17e